MPLLPNSVVQYRPEDSHGLQLERLIVGAWQKVMTAYCWFMTNHLCAVVHRLGSAPAQCSYQVQHYL